MPVRNAATRSGEAAFGSAGVAPSVFAITAPQVFRKLERAGIDPAARTPGELDRMRHGILDALRGQLLSEETRGAGPGPPLGVTCPRADHQHEFPARHQSRPIAPHFA